ncbi:transcriptional repressor NrdR [Eggerthellaceae bacterium zg-1084]|uniref:Transcriptional repressor NrdR n=1 Tax=Berryella wangjianweii TaxID=2734634 RepID=A0A6M8IZ27_9ACTN|nr:transcriptional regulator NrdR [Berryella wangjianweii]NPD30283.1 transcriptional repressor NrdR [Berryella wangjianweii]NPD32586.1 transcriptional repressor NrdR [Eggerthellaceae bacterium zg-997]QKF06970.1 transcriptional repressor NrdR [Berryella wangjianweii]
MRCSQCGKTESKVVDSRPAEDGASIRRRRECLSCGNRFTTYERINDTSLMVVKSDGSSEAFDRGKLMRGLLMACAKRPVSPDQLDALIDGIELHIKSGARAEVASKELGSLVMERLAALDDVAYVRFASVYKHFNSIEEFAQALEELR